MLTSHLPVFHLSSRAFLFKIEGANVSGKKKRSKTNTAIVRITLRYSVQRQPKDDWAAAAPTMG
jgi:hypothetical protein